MKQSFDTIGSINVRLKLFATAIMFVLIVFSINGYGQKAPFNRGVNLTNWFQVDSPRQINFSKYTRTDFEQIKSLGCDVIRLPINLHFMTSGAPDYTIDPVFYSLLDQVVAWCEELELHLILDNHTFSVEDDTDPRVGTILEKVWPQMAEHYLDASTLIYFEVLNEPHGIADNTWNTIQQKVVAAIRQVNTKHTIIVGPASWNSYNNLDDMPLYSDTNLIYTFHFYDPFLFTHQGASWSDMGGSKDIPFPYSADEMPACPDVLKGTWVQNSYNNYRIDGTLAKVESLINIAAAFSRARNVPVFCGEFGVYDQFSPADDRAYWYGVVRNYLEEKNIAWTIWDYHGGFGLFKKNSQGLFQHDLNIPVLEALGLNIPEQIPYVQLTDSAGFMMYTDYLGPKIYGNSSSPGVLDYYSSDNQNSGDYCMYWTGGAQYQGVIFDFKPNKDLSYLVSNGYALSLLVRSNIPNLQFDIRFLDTKTDDPSDHPWRMRKTITNSLVPNDGQWHKLFMPLSGFTEHGSWDNETWLNPEGKFDWSNVDKLEIVQEYAAMGSYSLWLDDVVITNRDTLTVREIVGREDLRKNVDFASVSVFSDKNQLVIENSSLTGDIQFKLVDITGKIMFNGAFVNRTIIGTEKLSNGLYLLHLSKKSEGSMVKKLFLNR